MKSKTCVITMRYLLILCVLWFAVAGAAKSAPSFPVNSLCDRAETILIVRVVSCEGGDVAFQRVEQLRGQMDEKFILQRREGNYSFKPGAEFLLFSQGDGRYGPPRPIVANPIEGQIAWCGWLPYAVARIDGQFYVDRAFAIIPGEPFEDKLPRKKAVKGFIWGLSLTRIKGIIGRFPYKPHINDHSR